MIGQLFQREIPHPFAQRLGSFAVFGLDSWQQYSYQSGGVVFNHLAVVVKVLVATFLYAVVITHFYQVGTHCQHQLTCWAMRTIKRVDHHRYRHLVAHKHLLSRTHSAGPGDTGTMGS